MYIQYFDLKSPPFSLAPNPRFLYMSPRHREALAHLLYGIDGGGGFVALTGEVGTGKTTLCRCLLEQIPDHVDVALIINPRLDAIELLANVCDELRVKIPRENMRLKSLVDALNEHLLTSFSQGRYTVILIDEAQNLSFDVLEQIRLLTNLETSETKLLKVILVGQPELNTVLERKDLRQLNQRITARYHLMPLSLAETATYIYHRLSVSGGYKRLFPKKTIKKIYRYTQGTPRLINIICDRALLGAYATENPQVTNKIVSKAASEVLPRHNTSPNLYRILQVLALVGISAWGLFAVGLSQPRIVAWIKNFGIFENIKTSSNNRVHTDGLSMNSPSVVAQPIVTTKPLPIETIKLNDILTTLPTVYRPTTEIASTQAESRVTHRTKTTQYKQDKARNLTHQDTQPHTPSDHFLLKSENAQQLYDLISDPKLSMPTALVHLSQKWGVKHSPDFGDVCAAARVHALRCLNQTADWEALRHMNRPAILKLSLPSGDNRYVTLTGLEKQSAILNFFDDTPHAFSFDDISPYWQGHYSIFWKSPDPKVGLMTPGYLSDTVRWLRKQLSTKQDAANEARNPNYFDDKLKSSVIEFQKQQSLFPDGLVGVMTLIALNSASAEPGIPKLENHN